MKNDNVNPFEGSEITSIIVVSDLSVSKIFYVEILGANLYREYGGDSIVLEFLGHYILLVSPGEPTEDKPNIYLQPPADKSTVSHAFTIRVKNCNKTYEILRKRGAEFLTPPHNRGAETRCFFRDPDGYLYEISEYNSTS